jgi:DNA-binding CsgD family transcriptional regulator
LSNDEKAELWRRWKAGQTLTDIALALSKRPGSIHNFVCASGGFAPTPRRRSPIALTLTEREEISRGLAAQHSLRAIASRMSRAPSTVSREIARHGGACGYRASHADESAWERARRAKACLLAQRPRLRALVANKLAPQWSAQQISGWLERAYPNDELCGCHTKPSIAVYLSRRAVC